MELFLESFWPMFRAGLTVSVPLMLVSFALGLVLAFIIALMRMSKLPPLKGIAWFIVWVIRGTPLLVQIFVIFFGLPSIGIVLKPIPSAIIALVVSQGAYNSEVIRAALTSIPKGQFEACKALGMAADVYWDNDRTKYDRPAPTPAIRCERCGHDIKPVRSGGMVYTPEEIAGNARKAYGSALCWACMKAVKAEKAREEATDENAG